MRNVRGLHRNCLKHWLLSFLLTKLSRNLIRGVPEPCSDSAIPNSLAVGLTLSDIVRVVDCHAGVLSSNLGGSKYFPLGITSLVAAVVG